MLAFANTRNESRYIEHIDVKLLSSDNHFITQEMVEKLIVQTFPRDSKIVNSELSLKKIEEKLNSHAMIAKSEVFVDVDGKLHAQVTQKKKAMARLMNSNGSVYIDENGNKMPLSDQFSAHVPVIYGELKRKK